jgi:hypothetical protein
MTSCPNLDSPQITLAQAHSARRASQLSQRRSAASALGDTPSATQLSLEDLFRPEERLPSSQSIPLAELLPLMRFSSSRRSVVEPHRRGRPLTNADVVATIDQVLNMLGDLSEETTLDQRRVAESEPGRHSVTP